MGAFRTVLGHPLILLYISGIFNVIRHGKPFLFADDSKVVCHFEADSLNFTLALINEDPESLGNWCFKLFMNFSADNSYLMT